MKMAKQMIAATVWLAGCQNAQVDVPLDCTSFSSSAATLDRMQQPSTIFVAGETITFQFAVTNNNPGSQTLTTTTCPWETYRIKNAAGQTVWEYGAGTRNAPQMMCVATQNYAPGETAKDSVSWDQRSLDDGTQVAAGQYTALVTDGTECGASLSKSIGFEIR